MNVGWATPTSSGFNALKEDYNPGDLGFDPLGLKVREGNARGPACVLFCCQQAVGRALSIPVCLFALALLIPCPALQPDDEEELKVMQTKELNNGRLAMIAIAGFALQEVSGYNGWALQSDVGHRRVQAWKRSL